jgi:hypothetical protein
MMYPSVQTCGKLAVLLAAGWLACARPVTIRAQDSADGSSAFAAVSAAPKILRVDFQHARGNRHEVGEVLIEASDGGLLFRTTDGCLWLLEPGDIRSRTETEEAFRPQTTEEAWKKLKADLPGDFLVHKTAHYLLVYNTSETYVRWVGDLLERLHRAFYGYWKARGIKLEEPRFPLIALVFDSRQSYLAYAERELGETAQAMIGYYHMETNRVTMFDLTGVEGLTSPGQKVATSALLTQIFSQPQAERTVATIVHEAVHQLSFNSGLQVRLADNPLWLSEGLAMFFETPDVHSSSGWGKIGQPNYHQLRMFRQYLARRPADSLTTLIADSRRFHEQDQIADAYAESWALTYFLLKSQPKDFANYMKELSELPPLGDSTSRERVELFKKHFGSDLEKLDAKFIKTLRALR